MFFLRQPQGVTIVANACLGMAGFLAGAAHGQPVATTLPEPARTLQASDASTVLPAVSYRSVFADLPRGVEQGIGDWKAADSAVGQFKRGHIDFLQWEKSQMPKLKGRP